MKTIPRLVVVMLVSLAGFSALGSDCVTNYKASGSLLKGKTYSTFADHAGLDPQIALQRLGHYLAAEGVEIQRTDESTGTIIGLVKGAPVEARAEAIANGTRVHLSVDLPTGAFANATTKATVCRIVDLPRVDPGSLYQHQLVSFVKTNGDDRKTVAVVESSTKRRIGKVALSALGGAVLGALHAKVTGGDVAEQAAIGAIGAAAVTFAITKIQDKQLANREEVMRAESYDPAQGYRAGVRTVTVNPLLVKPGQKITIVTTYWALTPGAGETFGVRRYAGIGLSGTFLRAFRFNPEPFQFGDGGGEYQTTIELDVPAQVPPGSYSLHWVVDGQSTGGDASASFTVAG